ncbi:DNA cytosine methyltransferase [Aerococcaceae bacterium NML191219]|nr:DNA cytosine methyltransferase [Aerococcaceae bacterium NML191219]
MKLTMGSLFDGSGGFPLASTLLDIQPLWASEVEPFPIRVTTKRLPEMTHLGDISTINGAEIKPVDIITFGSPCQDLSIAGKRSGLGGSKSSLFYEAIRVIKEMREVTNGEKPRFIIWENVPGAFSSNKGEDFKCVIESICQIKDEHATIPQPKKWLRSGEILGDDYSIAWRVLDAKHFGVPQRRKRIFLVVDFNGEGAGKILFESESLSGDFNESFKTWKNFTRSTQTSTLTHSSYSLADQGGERMDVTENFTVTLRAKGGQPPFVFENHAQDLRFKGPMKESPTLGATLGTGGNNQPFVLEDTKSYDVRFTSDNTKNVRANVYETDISRTIDTGGNYPESNQGGIAIVNHDVYATSKNSHHTQAEKEMVASLVASDYKDPPLISCHPLIVRRLTPTECGRLQGFPDWWCQDLEAHDISEEELIFWRGVFETYRTVVTKGKKSKTDHQITKWLSNPYADSAAYKMWGNGVALPCVLYVLSGIQAYLKIVENKQ